MKSYYTSIKANIRLVKSIRINPLRVIAICMLLGLLTGCPPATGPSNEIIVPDNYGTIQEAIDAAPEGSTVLVRPDTYIENIEFPPDWSITVRSTHGAESTTIDGGGSDAPVVTYSAFEFAVPSWAGTGNIVVPDPLFVSEVGRDFHLKASSPCIDAGDNSAPDLPATDIDGDARIINGIVDMGADEYTD